MNPHYVCRTVSQFESNIVLCQIKLMILRQVDGQPDSLPKLKDELTAFIDELSDQLPSKSV